MISTAIRRFTALTMPLALCWSVWTILIAPPLDRIVTDRDDMTQRRDALRRYRRLESEIPIMQSRLAEFGKQADEGRYLAPGSSGLMAALLQDKVQGLVSSTAGLLHTSRTMQSVVENGFERVGVEIALTADPSDLRKLLRALSDAEPDILVERLAIQTPEADQPADTGTRPTFDVVMTLSSFAKPRPKTDGAAP